MKLRKNEVTVESCWNFDQGGFYMTHKRKKEKEHDMATKKKGGRRIGGADKKQLLQGMKGAEKTKGLPAPEDGVSNAD